MESYMSSYVHQWHSSSRSCVELGYLRSMQIVAADGYGLCSLRCPALALDAGTMNSTACLQGTGPATV